MKVSYFRLVRCVWVLELYTSHSFANCCQFYVLHVAELHTSFLIWFLDFEFLTWKLKKKNLWKHTRFRISSIYAKTIKNYLYTIWHFVALKLNFEWYGFIYLDTLPVVHVCCNLIRVQLSQTSAHMEISCWKRWIHTLVLSFI